MPPSLNAQGTEADFEAQTSAPINDGSKVQCEDFGETDVLANDPELQQAAIAMAKHFMGLEKFARRSEIIDPRRQRFYRRQVQYINWDPGLYGFVPYPNPGMGANGAPGADTPRYTDVYDIYWPYERALISVGCQNPPGVNFEPDDPTKGSDIAAARTAENFRFFVDRVNQRKKLQADIMGNFCTDGRTILYTRSVRDAQRFGLDENGQPNSVELISVHGVLESKVTPITTDKMEQWVATFLSDELEINMGKMEYPAYADNIKQGTSGVGEQAYERMARIGVLQGTKVMQNAGDAYAHLATRHRGFFRPAAFLHCPDAIKKQFLDLFPDGMKLVTCGDAYCGSYNQTMDDHLRVGWPAPGDGAAKPSMLNGLVTVQDAYNDYRNLEKEIFDFSIPVTYRDSATGDIEALREQTSEPGNNVAVTRPDGLASLSAAFYTEPPPAAPPSMVQAYQDLVGAFAQFQTGAQPALFGGSDPDNQTKGGIAMLRDQAMGQFSVCWGALQELMAGAYKQAVMCRAKSATPGQKLNVKVPGKNGRSQVAEIDVDNLAKGNFHAYPDMDSSFPETTGSKRQTVMSMVTQAMLDPTAVEAWGILEPENLEIQRELLGVHDWVIPAANANDKQLQEIEILLKQRPVPDLVKVQKFAADKAIEDAVTTQAAQSSLPPPQEPAQPDPTQLMKSSIQVNVDWDFHQFEYQTIKDWLSSPDGLQEAKTNPWGILNVQLHGKEHQEALAMQPPMAPPIPILPPKQPPMGAPSQNPVTPGPPTLQ